MELTDDRNCLKITKSKRFCAIKGDKCDFVNRRTVANIRRTEYAVMDCPLVNNLVNVNIHYIKTRRICEKHECPGGNKIFT